MKIETYNSTVVFVVIFVVFSLAFGSVSLKKTDLVGKTINNNNNNTLFNEGNIIYWLPSSLQYGPP